MESKSSTTPVYINSTGYYIPEGRVTAAYFARLHSKPQEWFLGRTGIHTRARANDKETLDLMAVKAVENAMRTVPFPVTEVDLILFASYSPDDTVGTTAHVIQREFNIQNAKVLYVSSACSSALNALEIVASFFKTGIASKALVVAADRNSTYSDDNDPQHGHLWGDAAAASFLSTEQYVAGDLQLVDIETHGLGHVGAGPAGVSLKPRTEGIRMPYGRDVFNQACVYIEKYSREILERNNLTVEQLDWFISHQANLRIVNHVCRELGLPEERTLNNIHELGNTGCGSSLLALAQNRERFKTGEHICIATFGGGYSAAAALLKVV
jgi:3-oxoacyl-[acyl-carrier-protein] synthase-3